MGSERTSGVGTPWRLEVRDLFDLRGARGRFRITFPAPRGPEWGWSIKTGGIISVWRDPGTNCSFFPSPPFFPPFSPTPLHLVFLTSWFSTQRPPEEELPTVQSRRWARALRALTTVLLFSLILGSSLVLWAYIPGCRPRKQDPSTWPPSQPSLNHGPRPSVHPPQVLCPLTYFIPTLRAQVHDLFLPVSCSWPQSGHLLHSRVSGPPPLPPQAFLAFSVPAQSFSPQAPVRHLCAGISWNVTWPLRTEMWPLALTSLALPVETTTGPGILFRNLQRRTRTGFGGYWVRETGYKILCARVTLSLEPTPLTQAHVAVGYLVDIILNWLSGNFSITVHFTACTSLLPLLLVPPLHLYLTPLLFPFPFIHHSSLQVLPFTKLCLLCYLP